MSKRAKTGVPSGQLELCLYIAGSAPHSVRAIENLRALCERHLGDRYALDIVDVLVDPRRALDEGVIATPTLVKRGPGTVQRVIGDLSEEAAVLASLGLRDAR